MSGRSTTIYTDGACSGNGQGNSRAGIGVHWPGNESSNISRPLDGRQTNQRAEIEAARAGIELAKSQGYRDITVRTDSHYVKNGAESWVPKWEQQGWRTSTGKEPTNLQEFQGLRDSMRGADVKFEYVPSASNPADRLAKGGASRNNY